MTNYTVLMAHDARLPEGMKRMQAGAHGKFQVEGWTRPDQTLTWQVTVPDEDAYAVNVLACRGDDRPVELTVSAAGRSVSGTLRSASGIWTRQALDGVLSLPKGPQTITLRARPLDGAAAFAASVFAVELVRPAVRDRLHEAAVAQRSDTAWLQKAGYGLMSHWTSETCPRRGRPKPYAQAAQDFDVEMLANQVQEAGAGFLVLTTSHAQFYFPAPIQAIDRILPGRIAPRDLVADLADALGKRGIRLMLYYHIGASSDPQWLKASGFWETDTSRIFGNWTAIISEVGQRYGDRLAGWWFDDGSINYYYRSAPWERLTRAAKAGNANRLVGYNPWILPSPTEFQDFCCGEGFRDAGAGGLVPVGGFVVWRGRLIWQPPAPIRRRMEDARDSRPVCSRSMGDEAEGECGRSLGGALGGFRVGAGDAGHGGPEAGHQPVQSVLPRQSAAASAEPVHPPAHGDRQAAGVGAPTA